MTLLLLVIHDCIKIFVLCLVTEAKILSVNKNIIDFSIIGDVVQLTLKYPTQYLAIFWNIVNMQYY